jgi:hypothetical protein
MKSKISHVHAGTIYIGAICGSLTVMSKAHGGGLEEDLLEEAYETLRDTFLENVEKFFPDQLENVRAYVGRLEADRGEGEEAEPQEASCCS